MKRTGQFLLAAVLLSVLSGSATAELCQNCRGKSYILSVGKCSSCDGQTNSGAFRLCKKCSAEQGRCQHCLARLGEVEKPPEKNKPGRPKPIDPGRSATYTFGKWKYRCEITAAGTRSEGRWGGLFFDGKKLPGPEVNDYYDTPWGPIYWVGIPKMRWGQHGWMTAPSPRQQRKGKRLPAPDGRLQPIELTTDDNGKTVVAAVGQQVVISLEGNPTTGYSWQTAAVSGNAVEQLGKPKYTTRPHPPGMVGVGGVFVFSFKAVKPGKAIVRLAYARPWEKNRPPARTFSATIEVRAD